MRPVKLPEFSTLTHEREQHTGLAALARRIQTADILWTENNIAGTPFGSAFWVVRRLKQVVRDNARAAHGRMLDVGCGIKPHETDFAPFVDKHYGLDYSPISGYRGNRADVCGDAGYLPFADGSFDTVLCTEVIVDLPDPERTISEFARILAPGGTLITTAAFVYPIHDKHDYYRFSPAGLPVIMERHGLTVEKIVPINDMAITLAVMINLYVYEYVFLWNKWLYPIGLLLRPLLWLFCFAVNLIAWVFEKIMPNDRLPSHVLTIAYKA